jgi:hypothetical protein
MPVEFLVELVDFLADGVPEVNNGRRRGVHSRRNPPCRYVTHGEIPAGAVMKPV